MYEKHFGLKSRPFRSSLDASGIFVGPAQVKVMTSLKRALAAPDAVVSVTGVVGVGKTTVVNRSLEAITVRRAVARVGRMHLAADEVLELLLTEFNVSRQPTGTIQRFAAFKRLLHDWAAGGTRAFIIVEDAERIGDDALIELEALTAADSGDSAGASIVLMGQPSLAERLSLPDLARLKQRTRLRQPVMPLTAAEVQGYLKHCIRAAGGEFDAIFDPGAIDMLYRCSEGVPRVLNNLCESVLAAAAEAAAILVMPQLVQHVANEEFGLQPTLPAASRSRAARRPETAAEPSLSRPAPTPQKPKVDVVPPAAAPVAAVINAEPPIAETITTDFEPIPVVAFSPEPEVRRPVVIERTVTPACFADAPKEASAVAPPTVAPTPKQTIVVTPSSVAEAPKHKIATTPVTITEAPKQKVAATSATVTEAPKQAVAVTPATVAEAPKQTIVEIAVAKPAEAPIEQIPELIQDTQPELVALPIDDDLPDLTDLVMPAKSNGEAKVAPKAKAAREATLPTLKEIPTLSGDFRVDRRAKAAPPKPAQPKPMQSKAAPAKAEPSKPAQTVLPQSKSVQRTVVNEPLPATSNLESKADTTITEIPAWDRDPTLAELRPDIAALEAALAGFPEPATKPEAKIDTKPAATQVDPKAKAKPSIQNFDFPEITLEKELQIKEIEAQELLRKSGPPDTREVDADAPIKRKHGFDLDRLAAELGKARSLEDVDDKLAETLFGEEMAQAAAEVAAMVAADEAASKLHQKDETKVPDRTDSTPAAQRPAAKAPSATRPAAPAGSLPVNTKPAIPKAAHAAPSAPLAKNPGVAKPMPPINGPVEITLGSYPDPAPAAPAATPEPIEEQFGTSMTATLKALSAAQMKQMEDPEPDEKEKPSRRLFGLFRGSD